MSDTSTWERNDRDRDLRIDEVCEAFEAQWRSGGRPRIEDHLPRVEGAARAILLAELLKVEWHYQTMRGEAPGRDDYARRFPEYPEVVAAAFPPVVSPIGPAQTVDHSHADTDPRDARPAAEPWPVVPGYQILGPLGAGGMGRVYRARDLKLDRVVAVKLIRGEDVRPEQREQFLEEARKTALLNHAHIIHINQVGEVGGLPYLELELVGGGNLAEKIGGKPQPPRDAVRMVELLARAAAYAHKRGIVHRDLKPANVLLTETGEPKIADFGLAKRTDTPGYSNQEGVAGTWRYMAPEQTRGIGDDIGRPADIYALGVILFEMLTGRVPFTAETTHSIRRAIREDPPPSPRSLNRNVPKALEAICLKCLRKEPGDRYASAESLADALADYLRGPLGRFWQRCRRNPIAAGVSLLAVFTCAVAGLMLFDASLLQVRRAGKLVVGIDTNCPPYSSWDGETPSGIDVEVAREVARRMKVEPVFHKVYWDWPDMVKHLEERKVDVLISCVTITPEREREVAFVEYARDPLVFVSAKDVPTRESSRGKTVAVQAGTSAHAAAKRIESDVGFTSSGFPATPDPFAAVRRGETHAALDHGRIARHHARLGTPELGVFDNIDPALADQRLGIALRRDAKALRATIENAIDAMRKDGTLDEILEKWQRP